MRRSPPSSPPATRYDDLRGIDPARTYHDDIAGRPLDVLDRREVIRKLT